jgi:hypothetical protein
MGFFVPLPPGLVKAIHRFRGDRRQFVAPIANPPCRRLATCDPAQRGAVQNGVALAATKRPGVRPSSGAATVAYPHGSRLFPQPMPWPRGCARGRAHSASAARRAAVLGDRLGRPPGATSGRRFVGRGSRARWGKSRPPQSNLPLQVRIPSPITRGVSGLFHTPTSGATRHCAGFGHPVRPSAAPGAKALELGSGPNPPIRNLRTAQRKHIYGD